MRPIIVVTACLAAFATVQAQVLEIANTPQDQTEWDWAAASACVLNFYEFPVPQCEIAEFTRTVADWHDFGGVDCCLDPRQGCNYGNYNSGYAGSIEDILDHWGIDNRQVASFITVAEMQSQLSQNRPFIIRWGWDYGGGHFLVGYGYQFNAVLYMDPWPSEGLSSATYSWMKRGGLHTWTDTTLMDESPDPRPKLTVQKLGAGTGWITSQDGGIDCGSTCRAAYDPGTKIVLSAAADLGSTFLGFEGCRNLGYTCRLTFSAAKTIRATFRRENGKLLATPRIAFGSLKKGQARAKTIRVLNYGRGFLSLGQTEIQGPGYSLEADGCAGKRLDPGASCRIAVRFSSTAAGTATGQVTLFSNDPGRPQAGTRLTAFVHD